MTTEHPEQEVLDSMPAIQQQGGALVAQDNPYMRMAEMAMTQGKIAEMKELLAMKREWDAEEARKEFTAAMANFKKVGLIVGRDKENKQYGSMYTTLGNLVNTASAAMAQFGLSVDWEPDHSKQGQVGITCTISHAAGYTKSVTLHAEPDKSGQKNPIQQMKSTATYLRGLTFEMVTGIATHESAGVNVDDDGAKAGSQAVLISDEQEIILRDLIAEYITNEDSFFKWIRSARDCQHVEKLSDIPASRFDAIHNKLNEIRKDKAKENG